MTSGRGGGRIRSGPPQTPGSARSEAKGMAVKYTLLPPAGYKGRAPRWPFEEQSDREKAVWREVWKTPQAEAWSKEKAWRLRPVALYVRWSVRAEAGDCSAAVLTQVSRLADQIGLTPNGLLYNGWKIATVVEVPTAMQDGHVAEPTPIQPRRPLTMMDGGLE